MKKISSKILNCLAFFIIIGTVSSYASNTVTNSYNTNSYTNSYNNSSTNTYKTTSKTAKEQTPVVDTTKKVYDYANLITAEEEEELYNKVQEFIDKYNMDMVIVTIDENPKTSSMAYADDFYDYNNFGIGSNDSGILFLIDMDNRNMWISTTGDAIKIYNDERIDAILDYTYDEISAKDYNGCAEQFIKQASYFASKGLTGSNKIVTIVDILLNSLTFAFGFTLILIIVRTYNT